MTEKIFMMKLTEIVDEVKIGKCVLPAIGYPCNEYKALYLTEKQLLNIDSTKSAGFLESDIEVDDINLNEVKYVITEKTCMHIKKCYSGLYAEEITLPERFPTLGEFTNASRYIINKVIKNSDGGVGILKFHLNGYNKIGTLEFKQVKGTAFNCIEFLIFLMQDKTFLHEVKKYQKDLYARKRAFDIIKREGMSGCIDYSIGLYNQDSILVNKKSLLHVSCVNKLNEGIGSIWIGDLVEIIALLLKEDKISKFPNRKEIRNKFKAIKYIKPIISKTCDFRSSEII